MRKECSTCLPLERVDELPSVPGVYVFYDDYSVPIYVGKSVNLRARVKSHISSSPFRHLARYVEYLLTVNEDEALRLEYQLIRQLKPVFNVQYSEEWGITALGVIDLGDGFPTVTHVRIRGDKISTPKRRNFKLLTLIAPLNVKPKEIVRWLGEAYGIRQCDYDLRRHSPKGCIYELMGLCSAPCMGRISQEEYSERLREAVKVLREGPTDELLESLEQEMWRLSDELRFEEAALVRDRLRALRNLRRAVASKASVSTFLVAEPRDGNLWIGILRTSDDPVEGLTASPQFKRFSLDEGVNRLMSEALVSEGEVIVNEEVLKLIYPKLVVLNLKVRLPESRYEEELLALLIDNMRERMRTSGEALRVELEAIGIVELNRAEAVDVSHVSGKRAYASLVVWKSGGFSRRDYRSFKVSEGGDDLKAIEEVFSRRAKYLAGFKRDESLEESPELILVDGGEHQLRAALRGLNAYGDVPDIKLLAMVKPDDKVLAVSEGVIRELNLSVHLRRFLARLRDEAHRFANYSRRRAMRYKPSTKLKNF